MTRITKRQMRRIILAEQHRLDEINVLKTFDDMMSNVGKAIDQKREEYIGPYMDKLRNWLDDNADKIPFYLSTEQSDERTANLKAKFEETMKKVDEVREEWKKENPDKDPPWEKSFLGIRASDWMPGLFHDPGREVRFGDGRGGLAEGKKMRITQQQLRRIIQEEMAYIVEEDQDLEEQDEIAGFTGPLGAGSPGQRRKRRRAAYLANAEAFGGSAK